MMALQLIPDGVVFNHPIGQLFNQIMSEYTNEVYNSIPRSLDFDIKEHNYFEEPINDYYTLTWKRNCHVRRAGWIITVYYLNCQMIIHSLDIRMGWYELFVEYNKESDLVLFSMLAN